MKKLISFLLLTAIIQQVCGQTETFDIATYTPPKDWRKDAGNGVVAFTVINSTTGAFCILAMYTATTSLGDPLRDFKVEWNDRVVVPHGAAPGPKTETATSDDGWKAVTGSAPIKVQELDAYAILTVFSGFGKKFSVLTMLNDQSYANEVDAVLKDIKLDKTAKTSTPLTNNPLSVIAKGSTETTGTTGTKGQFGSVIYYIPNGWHVTKYPEGDILSPNNMPKGEFLEVWIQAPLNFSGTIEQALQKSFDETAVNLPAVKMNDVNGGNYTAQAAKTSFRGWQYIRCSGGIKMGAGEYPKEFGLDMFVIKVNGRYEKIAITKSRNNCDYSTYYPTSRTQYGNDIENFFFSLQFPDFKETNPRSGTVKGDGITGDWQGIAMSVGLAKPGAGLGAELKGKHLIFFSNGQALYRNDIPVEGLDGINTWIGAESNRRDWGTYTFSNGRGNLKLPYADIPLRMENGKLVVTTNNTDHAFVKTNSVDGARFNGNYAMSSKDFLGGETGNHPLLSFTADGKFTDNGALKILTHPYVSCVNPANAPGSGTYEVKNYSVVFNYSDGRKLSIAFLGEDYDKSNPSPAILKLSFNEDILRRQ